MIPVHLYGQIAPFEQLPASLAERGIAVVEDAAQSQGATRHGRSAGRFGAVAATSFYPGKNLGAYGDAGRGDHRRRPTLAERGAAARRPRQPGEVPARRVRLQLAGSTRCRPSCCAPSCAGSQRWNEQRRAAAAGYDELLAGVPGVRPPVTLPGNEHVWHLYVVRVPRPRRGAPPAARRGHRGRHPLPGAGPPDPGHGAARRTRRAASR